MIKFIHSFIYDDRFEPRQKIKKAKSPKKATSKHFDFFVLLLPAWVDYFMPKQSL